ncbi:MAG TPA: hypothetical protein VKT81_00625 [Bryobacteraceae bacterium]|nr:hypothetical protein [Bryobacteraceae bacterium]
MNKLALLLPLCALFAFNAAADVTYFAAVSAPGFNPSFPIVQTSASFSGTINGATNSAAANLATGMLGVLNAGTNVTTPGVYETIAQLGDTITATSTASGLSGLNLGVNITENGTTSFTDPSSNFSFLWVYMFKPGTFDQTTFVTPGNVLISRGYILGSGTNTNIADSLFTANDVPVNGVFGDGQNTIPLQIPFDTIGSNFQIELVLGSAELVTGANETWSADFIDPINVSLSAPDGVTLTSASGLLPGAVVPEPSSLPISAAIIFLAVTVAAKRRRKTA